MGNKNAVRLDGLLPQQTLERIARQILRTMEETDLPTKDRVKLLAELTKIRAEIARAARIRAERRADELLTSY